MSSVITEEARDRAIIQHAIGVCTRARDSQDRICLEDGEPVARVLGKQEMVPPDCCVWAFGIVGGIADTYDEAVAAIKNTMRVNCGDVFHGTILKVKYI